MSIRTLTKTESIDIRNGIMDGQVHIISKEGLLDPTSKIKGSRGDLRVKFRIVVPKHLNES